MALSQSAKELRTLISNEIDDVWQPEHDDEGHHYRHTEEDVLVDSVTTKLILEKPRLITWAGRQAAEYVLDRKDMIAHDLYDHDKMVKRASLAHKDTRDDAADVGTQAHNAVEDYLQEWIDTNEQPDDIREFIDDDADGRVYAAARSAEESIIEHDVIPLATEITVGSTELAVAGTVDLVAILDDEIIVWDWKTSNNVYDNNALQVATYQYLIEEMLPLRFDGSYVAHLNKNRSKFRLYEVTDPAEAFSVAKGVYKAYDWKRSDTDKLQDINQNVMKL